MRYVEAIARGLLETMERDERVFLMGEGVDGITGVYGTVLPAFRRYGENRLIDTPLSENGVTGIAAGAAMAGFRPVLFHQRNDFLLLTCDQLVNHAAKVRYVTNGHERVPLTIVTFIAAKPGEGAQHSQSLQAIFAHIPGLEVLMPASAHDAKGCLVAAVESDDPTLILYHRSLFNLEEEIPEGLYRSPIGKARMVREGTDATVVAVSAAVGIAEAATKAWSERGRSVELIDLVSVRPWDEETVFRSVRKTGRLVVVDTGWKSFGVSAEIVARVAETCHQHLKAPPRRVAWPETPVPASPELLKHFHPTAEELLETLEF